MRRITTTLGAFLLLFVLALPSTAGSGYALSGIGYAVSRSAAAGTAQAPRVEITSEAHDSKWKYTIRNTSSANHISVTAWSKVTCNDGSSRVNSQVRWIPPKATVSYTYPDLYAAWCEMRFVASGAGSGTIGFEAKLYSQR